MIVANFRPLKFLKAAGSLGVTSVALSFVLFAVSIVEHERDKNLPAYVFICLAPVFFAFGAYLAWSAERDNYEKEEEKNQKPDLAIELRAAFFDVSQIPLTQNVQVHIYLYLSVANLRQTPTRIRSGSLTLTVGGVEYTGHGDDLSVAGNYLEHNTAFRLGGEKKGSVFSETFTPVRRLTADISFEYPLLHGVNREGIMVFTFKDNLDWDKDNPYVMNTTKLRISLTDTFGQQHVEPIDKLDIPNGTLQNMHAPVIGII